MTVTIKDIKTSYVCEGTGTPVLFLPGWAATAAVYHAVIKQLSEKYTVYALELPGFGVTPEPNVPWSIDDYADFVSEFVKAMEIDNFIAAGHSYGGRIILKLFDKETDFNISKVLFIDAAGIKHELSAEAKARQDKFKKLKNFYSGKVISSICPKALEKLQKKYGSADYAAASDIMRQTMVKSISEDLSENVKKIDCETILIWGRDDTATPISDAEFMHANIEKSTLEIIDNAGHFPFIDQPFDFMKILKKNLLQ